MMRKASTGFVFTAVIWVVVIGLGTVGSAYYKKWVVKERQKAEAQMHDLEVKFKEQWQEALDTCADTPLVDSYASRVHLLYQAKLTDRLQHIDEVLKARHKRVKLACDSFSGYCVFRSREFQAKLAEQSIRLHLVDDNANYNTRIKALKSGETPVAVFTVDALINNSALFDSPPADIVLVIDESQGADAMVSYKQALPNIQALNRKDIQIVLTPDSPSETLARLVRFHYDFPDLPKECFIEADGAKDVYDRFKAAEPSEPMAFVLWEPFASRLLQEYPQAHKLIDTSDPKCRGYIMDVLVVQKEYLKEHKEVVEGIVRAYLLAAAAHQEKPDGMIKLVQADSTRLAAADPKLKELSYAEAEKVIQGIRWKKTKDNYALLDIAGGAGAGDSPTLEEMIKKITTVLVKTKAISRNTPPSLVDKEICTKLQKEDFDESKGTLVGTPPPPPSDPSKDWSKLQVLTSVKKEPITFSSGSLKLSTDNVESLQELAGLLKKRADYYVEIVGSAAGTSEEDDRLAQNRANEVFKWLRDEGRVDEKRLKAKKGSPGRGTVSFVFYTAPD